MNRPWTLLALIGGSCAAAPTRDEMDAIARRTLEVAYVREVDPGFAERGRALVDGFPDAIDDESFWPGDRVLFGVESFDGQAVERFYLLFESLGRETRRGEVAMVTHDRQGKVARRSKLRTGFTSVKVTLFDEQLRELRSATSEVAREVHELGLFPYALDNLGPPRPRTLATARTRRSLFLLHADWGEAIADTLRHELMGNDAMRDLAGRLSISPGWFEAVGFLGAQLWLSFGTRRPRLVKQPIERLPAGEEAIECATSIWGKQPILVVNVVMVPAVGPLAMTAGIVTLTGYRAQEPDRRFVIRLLGVARGVEPAR
ncbi:MAG TPA: hypothetical protein VF384_10125 [Planctomycetota bacterium]